MGFGFNLFFLFIVIPVSVILIITFFITRKRAYGKLLGFVWLGMLVIATLSLIVESLTGKMELKKSDYYGNYIINRNFFPGTQADWQYKHFRFEIQNNDSIYFYETRNDTILKVYKGFITTIKPFNSERLVLNMEKPSHHILTSNPTIYRGTRSFYLVFNSPKFGNMYFIKGKWEPIKQ